MVGMRLRTLDYSGPHTNGERWDELALGAIQVGAICWGAIGIAMGLFVVAELLPKFDVVFVVAALFILLVETLLAFFGFLSGLFECFVVRVRWRGLWGALLNLSALLPATIFIVGLIWRR
jgi:hypothetical protein